MKAENMAVIGYLLFGHSGNLGLDNVLRHKTQLLKTKIDALSETFFNKNTDDNIADHISKAEAVEPLVVDFTAATPSVEEVQVDIYNGFDSSPIRVGGLKATKSIPFTGDADLWRLGTNLLSMNPPRGDVRGNRLIVGITVAAQQVDEAARYIDQTIASLPEYIRRQSVQIEQYNASLASEAIQWIRLRRQLIDSANALLKKLGG